MGRSLGREPDADKIGVFVETVLHYWPVTIFLPTVLLGLLVLVLIVRATDRR